MTTNNLFDKVLIVGSCWEWQACTSQGYGVMRINGKKCYAHRLSYEYFNNALKAKECVLHICDNRKCINPKHLRVGSKLDNSQDMVAKKRHPFGSRRHNAKLTEDQIVEIRSDSRPIKVIASDYGVSKATVSMVRNHKIWKHV